MDYPQDFPAESRGKVEAATIRAGRKFDAQSKRLYSSGGPLGQIRPRGLETIFWDYALKPFLAFAEEAYRLRLWPVDEMNYRCREALRHLVIDAYYHKGRGIVADPICADSGGIRWQAQQEIERKPEWRKYENLLLKLVEESPNHEGRVTNIARNINKLRKECGWSIDQLAKETGIDKKSILSHLNKGTRPIPRILKEYAQAFSKALNRTIIAPDLEI